MTNGIESIKVKHTFYSNLNLIFNSNGGIYY